MRTWYDNLRTTFPLRQYLQLYGYVNVSSYHFQSLPAAYATQTLLEFTPVAFEANRQRIGWLLVPSGTRVDAWVMLVGGSDWED